MALKPKQKKNKIVSKVAEAVKKEAVDDSTLPSEVLEKTVTELSPQVDNNNQSAENEAEPNQKTDSTSPPANDEVPCADCQLDKEQVVKAVNVAFRALKASKEKISSGNLFEDDPEHITLLVTCIKVDSRRPKPIIVNLPHSLYSKESDICLIVKDLEKGWKSDHEPTVEHYKELLGSKGVDYISEIMPLRQLRVEYKPYEARAKLAKRFDTMLMDFQVAKHVPRYLGKAFYSNGKLPISVNMNADDLDKELKMSLAKSTMSMTNNGTSTSVRVGSTAFTEEQVVDNIMAVYETLSQEFPGKFVNIRNLSLRIGSQDWSVPIYVSYASRQMVVLPPPPQEDAPLVDDLSTLPPGMKVAVHRSGKVEVIKDENYQKTPLDDVDDENKKPSKSASAKKQKKSNSDDEDDLSESEGEEEYLSEIEDGEESEDQEVNGAPDKETTSKKTGGDDDSSDDGDALEDEYMEELALMEEEAGVKAKDGVDKGDEPPVKKTKTKAVPTKKIAKPKAKKQKAK